MCRAARVTLARRYAQAYVNVYDHELTGSVCGRIQALADFLATHERIMFFLTIPTIANEVKVRGITFLCEKFELPDGLKKTILLILRSKRASLLRRFFERVVSLYQEKHGILSYVVSSSHEITEPEKDLLCRFLKKLVEVKKINGDTILCTYEIDKKLIAGLRMCSATHLWEHSVAQQLRSVQWLTLR